MEEDEYEEERLSKEKHGSKSNCFASMKGIMSNNLVVEFHLDPFLNLKQI